MRKKRASDAVPRNNEYSINNKKLSKKSARSGHENMSENRYEKKQQAANKPHFFKISKYLMSSANKYL